MKKCAYCGTEYPDDAERCAVDNELLPSNVPPPLPETAAVLPPPLPPFPAPVLSDRQMRIAEVALVCLIAFGTGILSSAVHPGIVLQYDRPTSPNTSNAVLRWITGGLREASALGLLWYVLARRGKSVWNLGLPWNGWDFVRSIILRVAAWITFRGIYAGLFLSGLTTVSQKAINTDVHNYFYSGGISLAAILYQFLNPFFEELIVRAYVMTEVAALTDSAAKAVIVSTVLQTSYHLYQGIPAALGHGAVFLLWSIYYARTNRIIPIILAHLYSDVGGTIWVLFRL